MGTFKDITGQRFGRLTALNVEYTTRQPNRTLVVWKCQCDCGNIYYVDGSNLRRGNSQSCGCLRSEKSKENIKVCNAAKKEIMKNGKSNKPFNVYKVTLKSSGESYYYTSILAIYDELTAEQIGCKAANLWNKRIKQNGFENKRCTISTIAVKRKKQDSRRNFNEI